MSYEQLLELDARRAFEATHRFEDLALFHVPFDELTGAASTEAVLTRMAGREGRVAIVGGSGSGKSSIIASVLGPFADELPEHVVPLRIPVAGEPDETVTQPKAFVRHLIATITRWASPDMFSQAEREELERGASQQRRRAGVETTRRFHIGAPAWFADAGFALEVKSTGEDIERAASTVDVVAESRRMIDLFRAHGRVPLFVIDDSDHWLRIPELDRSPLANAFFTKNVRTLATELACGFVIAVHDDYLDYPGYIETESHFSTVIHVPWFETGHAAGPIGKILQHRMDVHEVAASVEEVFDADAVTGLEWHYFTGAGGSLRDVLQVADRSVQHACSDAEQRVTKQLVIQALTEFR
ncbi:MAG: hypothetical protein M3456_00025 [Actinomycetota bacterium]|nr:hypothetical protein [Actinomycetota bacterium]